LELNASAVEIINLLDGKRTPEQVALEIVNIHDIGHDYPIAEMVVDVLELCDKLSQTGVLEIQPD
jgi:hypothetical protein